MIEMNKLDTSLEDAFLALTRGGSKQYGGKKLKKLKTEKKDSADEGKSLEDMVQSEQVQKSDEDILKNERHDSDMEGGEK